MFSNPNGRSCHITSKHRTIQPQPAPVQARDPTASPFSTPRRGPNTDFRAAHTPNFNQGFSPIFQDDDFGPPVTPARSNVGPANSPPGNQRPQPVPQGGVRTDYHPNLTGTPCHADGSDVPDGASPPPPDHPPPDDWFPFRNSAEFNMADFLYREEQMGAKKIDKLMAILAQYYGQDDPPVPFANYEDLYSVIDGIEKGDAPWQSFSVSYTGDIPESNPPPWMSAKYEVWWRNPDTILSSQLSNPAFAKEMDYAPKREFGRNGKRVYKDFMSGNWSWKQADAIFASDPSVAGSAFVPVILGSDKTTTSVATGNHEYYPLYISNGCVHNNARRSHRNAVSLLGFLAIPKTDKQYAGDAKFRTFRRQLFHSSLHQILLPLKDSMTTPVIRKCADGHFRRIIYGIGPYIADYPEQALLACIVQGWCPRCYAPNHDLECDPNALLRNEEHRKLLQTIKTAKELWDDYGIVNEVIPFTDGFPRADICTLLSPDLLHQLIKGTFKDHLVDWVVEYIEAINTPADARAILADIDRRIACVPSFPGLRRFPDGRGFKQWTGDDSKALMKVFLPAISAYVPLYMVQAISSFLEFCYLVRRSVIDEDCLKSIEKAIADFHLYRTAFQNSGIREDFNLPRQHSIRHYPQLIREFGAPNGLCSSITESKHIKAVKEPYRRTNRYNEMGQMLLINQRMDKLAAARVDFIDRKMFAQDIFSGILPQVPSAPPPDTAAGDVFASDRPQFLGEVTLAKTRVCGFPRDLPTLATYIQQPQLPILLQRFLYDALYPNSEIDSADVPMAELPHISSKISVYSSAVATFFAPSDMCGTGGMLSERIRSIRSWRGGPPRYDCIFAEKDDTPGFAGLLAARVRLFLSFQHNNVTYPCALVHWFSEVGTEPCRATRMWIVEPDRDRQMQPIPGVIHIESILRGAHLIPVFGDDKLPRTVSFSNSLDLFKAYYVNKFADHHSHEVAF